MRKAIIALMGIISLILAVACAPKAAPAPERPPAAPAAPAPAPAPAPRADPAPSPEEAAWAQVVQAAKRESPLTVYSVHITGDMAIETKQAFTRRTGIPVEIISSGTSAALIERIKAERRASFQFASILTGAGVLVLIAKQEGLTQRVGDIPEIKKNESTSRYDPQLDKDGHILSMFQITMSPWINTKLVRPGTEPKSWLELLKPEWKGKIGIANPDTAPNSIYIYYGLTSRGRLNQSYFTELTKQQLQFQATTGLTSEALARGQIPLSFANTPASNSLMPYILEGAPVRALDMAEGVVTYRSGGVALLQGAPHPNAARVFINWLFTPEGQTIFHKYSGTVGFRKDVPSFVPPQGQFTPANPVMMNLEDEVEIAKIQRERTLTKLLRGG